MATAEHAINSHGDYWNNSAFTYDADDDSYECPADPLPAKKTYASKGPHWLYTSDSCEHCALKVRCPGGKLRRVTRHFDEAVPNEVAERTR